MTGREGRIKVLQRFLDQDWIYSTGIYRDLYEKTARENLKGSIANLHQGRDPGEEAYEKAVRDVLAVLPKLDLAVKAAQEALKDHREAMDALQAVSPPGIVYATRDRKLHAHLEKGSPLPPCVKAFCDVITQDVNEDTIVTLKP